MRYVVGELRPCSEDSHCSDTKGQICEGRLCRCPVGTVLHYGKCVASLSKWKILVGGSAMILQHNSPLYFPMLDDGFLQMTNRMDASITTKVYIIFFLLSYSWYSTKFDADILKLIPTLS